jgi:hypothetical protein
MVELLDVESIMNKNSRTIEQLCSGMAAYYSDNDILPSDITCEFSEDGNDIPDPTLIQVAVATPEP